VNQLIEFVQLSPREMPTKTFHVSASSLFSEGKSMRLGSIVGSGC